MILRGFLGQQITKSDFFFVPVCRSCKLSTWCVTPQKNFSIWQISKVRLQQSRWCAKFGSVLCMDLFKIFVKNFDEKIKFNTLDSVVGSVTCLLIFVEKKKKKKKKIDESLVNIFTIFCGKLTQCQNNFFGYHPNEIRHMAIFYRAVRNLVDFSLVTKLIKHVSKVRGMVRKCEKTRRNDFETFFMTPDSHKMISRFLDSYFCTKFQISQPG